MREVDKSNVVQIRDYAHRRGKSTPSEGTAADLSVSPVGELCAWPRTIAPYPGGIDDLPV